MWEARLEIKGDGLILFTTSFPFSLPLFYGFPLDSGQDHDAVQFFAKFSEGMEEAIRFVGACRCNHFRFRHRIGMDIKPNAMRSAMSFIRTWFPENVSGCTGLSSRPKGGIFLVPRFFGEQDLSEFRFSDTSKDGEPRGYESYWRIAMRKSSHHDNMTFASKILLILIRIPIFPCPKPLALRSPTGSR
uniref:Uncharacterized protein n=1 Tax=Candidatus Kentrum sp. TC TaxID=2126339 RepID=A0A451A5G5_9GAMM|nr:MAG: hypothetical protein BECKTC1821F_GA0114240_10566 [Candidatus Kentron sp. TC]